ncbi:hypothetical protein WN943_013593 [Citrus x changshan-huyou]
MRKDGDGGVRNDGLRGMWDPAKLGSGEKDKRRVREKNTTYCLVTGTRFLHGRVLLAFMERALYLNDVFRAGKTSHRVVFVSCQFRVVSNLDRLKPDLFNNRVKILRPKSDTEK